MRGPRTGQRGARGGRVNQIDAGIAVERGQFTGKRVDGHHDHRPFRPFMARQSGGDQRAPLFGHFRSEFGIALQSECAHRPLQIGCRGSGGGNRTHPLEYTIHRRQRRLTARSGRLNRQRGQHRGQQFARRYAAAHLHYRIGACRGSDHQIGGLRQIDTSFGEARDDADQPGISGGPATTENKSNVANHQPDYCSAWTRPSIEIETPCLTAGSRGNARQGARVAQA
ncbi:MULTISPECIES: hypothetical protein [unclassified Mesorhizobium]|uniref:hypothetical protein n=1 Tax=unclassified Mesorhizobium TaxID=325217 RepID=UPI001FEDA6D9|nr:MULTISPECIES: hypothetical protein [unclassified Mesorhizobium]